MNGVRLDLIRDRLVDIGIDVDIVGDAATLVVDAFHDDRRAQRDALFCCVEGARFDGHEHAGAAVRDGAVALLCRRRLDVDVPQIVVPDVRVAMGPVAALVHGDPSSSLRCIGVTGTNGKTTTATLLGDILRAAGSSPEVIGTLTGERTTPEATDLQRQLADALGRGRDAVVMEVSSHALDQHRVDGMHFEVAVFTNLSRDHLDHHGTMEAYFRAKARLFEADLSAQGVVDIDDAHGRLLADTAAIPIHPFGRADAEPVRALAPLAFTWASEPVHMALSGGFNISNALAAATSARVLGIDDHHIRAGLSSASVVPGRFETIDAGQPFAVVVDYAHTPDGLAGALEAARGIAGSARVLVAFGAGGDRDREKRPMMGAAAARTADVIVITSDNSRSEDPAVIADAIRAGIRSTDTDRAPRTEIVLDRREAITEIIGLAREGDVVVIAGKGHETTQTTGDTVVEFDDRVVAREVLAASGFAS